MDNGVKIPEYQKQQWKLLVIFSTVAIMIMITTHCGTKSETSTMTIGEPLKVMSEKNQTPAVIQLRSPGEQARVAQTPFLIRHECTVLVDIRNAGEWLRSRMNGLGKMELDPIPKDFPKLDRQSPLQAEHFFDLRTEKGEYELLKDLLDRYYSAAEPNAEKVAEEEILELLKRSNERRFWDPLVEQYLRGARLVLDGEMISDLQPKMESYWVEWDDTEDNQGKKKTDSILYRTLRFDIQFTEDNKPQWRKILSDLGFGTKPLEVSLAFPQLFGLPNTEIMPTEVVPTAPSQWQRANFTLALGKTQIAFGIVFVVLFGVFIYFVARSNLLCVLDSQTGLWHFSLGLCQMACWFFVISSCYVFLWIALGDHKTLSNKELLLLGITTTSGLGSFLVFGKGVVTDADSGNLPGCILTAEQVKSRSPKDLEKWLAIAANRFPSCDIDEYRALKGRLDHYKGGWKSRIHRVLYDLLSETNNGIPSFHRFQLIGWTVTFVFIFVSSVYHDLAMPEFSNEQLILIGISNGTYLGFKWKDYDPSTT